MKLHIAPVKKILRLRPVESCCERNKGRNEPETKDLASHYCCHPDPSSHRRLRINLNWRASSLYIHINTRGPVRFDLLDQKLLVLVRDRNQCMTSAVTNFLQIPMDQSSITLYANRMDRYMDNIIFLSHSAARPSGSSHSTTRQLQELVLTLI